MLQTPLMVSGRRAGALALLALCAASSLAAQGARNRAAMPMVERNLIESLASAPQFSTFTRLVRRAELADTLRGYGPFTIFAPTNAAFARVPSATLARLERNRALLRAVVLRHVMVGSAFRHHIVGLHDAIMMSGDTLSITAARETIRLDARATVVAWTLRASNGAIHTIDNVLLPTKRRRSTLAMRGASSRRP